MDFVKKAADSVKGATGSSGSKSSSSSGGQDYVDKGFDTISKKAGHDFSPETDEKITDAGRQAYEKATGSKVNSKVSN